MGLAKLVLRTVAVMTVLVSVGYVLRPVAWEVEARLHDFKEILYRAGGKHLRRPSGVELPLATDENGLRRDTIEKIGDEETAKIEQLRKSGEGAKLPETKRKGQLIQVVDQGTQLTRGQETQTVANSERPFNQEEVVDNTLLGRLTRRGAWRGIVEPYLGQPRTQPAGDGKRTTTADVESSDESSDLEDENPLDKGPQQDGSETKRDASERGGIQEEADAGLLEALLEDGENEGTSKTPKRPDGVRLEEAERPREDLLTKSNVTERSETKKEGVKQFLAVNADLQSGLETDEAVSGTANATGVLTEQKGKPKPREVIEEEGGKGESVNQEVDGWLRRDEMQEAETGDGSTSNSEEDRAPRIWQPAFREGAKKVEVEKEVGGLADEEAMEVLVSGEDATLQEAQDDAAPRIWQPAFQEETKKAEVEKGDVSVADDGAMQALASGEDDTLQKAKQDAAPRVWQPAFQEETKKAEVEKGDVNVSDDGAMQALASGEDDTLQKAVELVLSGGLNATQNATDASAGRKKAAGRSWPLIPEMRRKIWERPEANSSMPAREEFTLRRELVEYWARNNTVVVTFANFAFLDFTTNWVRHLTDLNVDNILVGAMDEDILETLYFAGVPVFDMKSDMSTLDAGWGSPLFHEMGRERLYLVNALLGFDVELLMCDTDLVFLRNPLEYVSRYPEADMLTSSDQLVITVTDESLEKWQEAHGGYNIGIVHYRPTDPTKAFAREWLDVATKDGVIWDQAAFNDIMRRKLGPDTGHNNGLFYAYDGSLKLGILPVSLFCSGHTFFVQKIYEATKLAPYAIHTTFQYSGTEGKRHRLREAQVFDDEPEYYDPPGGLLAYNPDIPTEILSGGEHSLETHFALVNYQLLQLRSALALAQVLNRTLVLPELWCRFDRLWYPHGGVLEGTATPQPFVCPADHILEIHKMVDSMPVHQFGADIRIREYSLLDNPRLPAEVTKSKVDVFICKEGDKSCETTEVKEGVELPAWVVLARDPTESQVKALLEPYRKTKLIRFSTMTGAFAGFDEKVSDDKFRARVKQYTGIWCCVNAQPGHIYYDFYWDEKPGWMPKPPKDASEDHPPLRLN